MINYRLLFRLALKLLGLWLIIKGGAEVVVSVVYLAMYVWDGTLTGADLGYSVVASLLAPVLTFGAGLYFLVGGKAVVNFAAPLSHERCGECWYDLHGLDAGAPCPECGTERGVADGSSAGGSGEAG